MRGLLCITSSSVGDTQKKQPELLAQGGAGVKLPDEPEVHHHHQRKSRKELRHATSIMMALSCTSFFLLFTVCTLFLEGNKNRIYLLLVAF